MKKIILSVLALTIFGCDDKADFKGTAVVQRAFTVNNVDNKPESVPAATYETKVTVDKKGLAKVRLGDDDEIRFMMNVKNLQSGEFVAAKDLGQNMDLRARVTTGQSQTGLRDRYEQCIYDTVYQHVCQPIGNGQVTCHYQIVGYRYGRQHITYYTIYQWQDLVGTLFQPGTSTTIANINGRNNLPAKDIATYVSPCMLY